MAYQSLLYHVVIRTHCSQRTITETFEKELYGYIYGFLKDKKVHVYRIGGMSDHIHILMSIPPTLAVSDLIRDMKRSASLYLRGERHKFPYFERWSESYAVFTYAYRDLEMIRNYIKNQKEHHKKVSLADELRQLLKGAGIDYDEKYFLKD